MLALYMQIGSIVEDKGFQDFLKVIDPKYVPPSHRTITREHLRVLLNYIDIWTSRATMGYVTVTYHFLTL